MQSFLWDNQNGRLQFFESSISNLVSRYLIRLGLGSSDNVFGKGLVIVLTARCFRRGVIYVTGERSVEFEARQRRPGDARKRWLYALDVNSL